MMSVNGFTFISKNNDSVCVRELKNSGTRKSRVLQYVVSSWKHSYSTYPQWTAYTELYSNTRTFTVVELLSL